MPRESFIDAVPVPAVLVLTVLLTLMSVELGYLLGRRLRVTDQASELLVGSMVGTTLGLVAFTLAFTFAMAAARFDARRQLVVDEASAIRIAYIHTSLIEEPYRRVVRDLLRKYVNVRLEAAARPETIPQAVMRSKQLQDSLWSYATALAKEQPESIGTSLLIQSSDDIVATHVKRAATQHTRIPGMMWGFMFLITALGMSSMGFHAGLKGARRTIAVLFLTISFSGIISLISDLDRPRHGYLMVSQQPIQDVKEDMDGVAGGATGVVGPP